MKTPFFHFVLCLIVSCLFYTTNNQTVAAPLPSAEDFCGVTDYKQDNRHYARRFTTNLNVGEPRTVRMIYFLPNDRPHRTEVVQRMKDEILNVQAFYAEAMQAHGYDMTFQVEMDAQGEPVVHRVDGQHPELSYIGNTSGAVHTQIEQVFDVRKNIYFIVVDNSIGGIGTGGNIRLGGVSSRSIRVSAIGGSRGKNGGTVLIPAHRFRYRIEKNILGYDKIAAHELGHAFGLQHDFRSGGYIMSYGAGRNRAPRGGPNQDGLSKCNADCLSVHPYFNLDIPTESGQPPTIELTSSNTYPTGSENVDIQIKVTDLEGIHQVILFVETKGPLSPVGFPEVKAYRKLTGEKEVIVNFEYDGDIPSTSFTKLSMYPTHRVHIAAIDINGDMYNEAFTLSEESSEQVDSSIISVKILGDNNQQEVRTEDDNYQMWNLPTGAKVRIGKGGAGHRERAVAFSPDGQYLAVASSIGIWLYDTVNYQELALLSSPWPITSIAFSPDGNAIAAVSGNYGGQSPVWDITTKEKIATFGVTAEVVAFSPDGKTIAYTSGMTIKLWDVITEQELVKIKSEDFIDTISFSHDGALIAGAGFNGLIKLWDVETGQNINTLSHKAHVNSIAFSPTENILASGSGDTTVKLWDVETGTEIFTIENPDPTSNIAFSLDGKTLAWTGAGVPSRNLPDTINLWDITTRSLIATYEDTTVFNIHSLALSPDEKTFVTVDAKYDFVKVCDISTGNTIDLGHVGLTPISFSLDSTMLASGGRRGVKLWDINTGQNVANIPVKLKSLVWLISFSPNNRTLAYRVSGEKFTRLWDVTTQTQVGIIENKSVNCWAFSPDGKTLAAAATRTIELWDVETGQNTDTFEGHLRGIDSIAYSTDGNTLASASRRGNTVRLWDIATKQNTETFEGDGTYAVFSPDGTMLVFHKLNVGVKLWNLVTQEMIIIEDDRFMTFLPDSTIMLLRSYSYENVESVSAWDAKTATLITTLDPVIFEGWKKPMFSPDGKTLAITSAGSTILLDPEVIYNQLPPLAPASTNITKTLQTELLLNYPNPFNPETWIPFRLAEDADVKLTIYDVEGRMVRTLDIGHSKAGVYESRNKAIYWDGRNDLGESVASGVYFYRLTAGGYSATKRMVILK